MVNCTKNKVRKILQNWLAMAILLYWTANLWRWSKNTSKLTSSVKIMSPPGWWPSELYVAEGFNFARRKRAWGGSKPTLSKSSMDEQQRMSSHLISFSQGGKGLTQISPVSHAGHKWLVEELETFPWLLHLHHHEELAATEQKPTPNKWYDKTKHLCPPPFAFPFPQIFPHISLFPSYITFDTVIAYVIIDDENALLLWCHLLTYHLPTSLYQK